MKAQLLWFPGCPNVDAARDVLRRALVASGLPPRFEEVDVTAPGTPEPLRGWGSPTILIDGRDVADEEPSGSCCRLYGSSGGEGPRGVPSEDQVRLAIGRARRERGPRAASLTPFLGGVLALLPVAACPACLPAYAGLLSSLGLGFLGGESVLGPLVAVALAVSIASVAWSARRHRRVGPLALAVAGSAGVVAGRLVWQVPLAHYAGVALLIGAGVLNLAAERSCEVRGPRKTPASRTGV